MKSPRRGSSGSPHLSFQFTGGVTWEAVRHALVSVVSCLTPLLIFHVCLRLHEKGLGDLKASEEEVQSWEEEDPPAQACRLPGVFSSSQTFQALRNLPNKTRKTKNCTNGCRTF